MKQEFSAGGIVYKKLQNSKTQRAKYLWLIRRPSPNPQYRGNLGWSWPKGWVDAKEKLEEAAIREVREEGGVVAKVVSKLPTLKVFFTNPDGEKVMKFITYFVMEYKSDAPEGFSWETEEVKWVTVEEARTFLVHKSEKELLTKASAVLLS